VFFFNSSIRFLEQQFGEKSLSNTSLMKFSFSAYFVTSILLVLGTVYYAYYTHRQFYPTISFLVSSKVAFIVIANLVFAASLFCARILKSIYFGKLRDAEIELLVDAAKYTVPETCLALTIFRNELSPTVFLLFGLLIFVKLLHKLSKCRAEFTEQLLPLPWYSQIRLYSLFITLFLVDGVGLAASVVHIANHGRSVLLLFAFEFGLLVLYTLNLTTRYVLQAVDAQTDIGLPSKGLYLMLVDMVCEVLKFVTYLCFFGLVFANYGMPIYILRDVYMAYLSCMKKVSGFLKYLQLTRNLDSRFENATPEEIAANGNCLVCREDLTPGQSCKKLSCGHVFHLECLRLWLQHQQTCPLCRYRFVTVALYNAFCVKVPKYLFLLLMLVF
jgi:E3 ubiquitin-protein ligase synoviolin